MTCPEVPKKLASVPKLAPPLVQGPSYVTGQLNFSIASQTSLVFLKYTGEFCLSLITNIVIAPYLRIPLLASLPTSYSLL